MPFVGLRVFFGFILYIVERYFFLLLSIYETSTIFYVWHKRRIYNSKYPPKTYRENVILSTTIEDMRSIVLVKIPHTNERLLFI